MAYRLFTVLKPVVYVMLIVIAVVHRTELKQVRMYYRSGTVDADA